MDLNYKYNKEQPRDTRHTEQEQQEQQEQLSGTKQLAITMKSTTETADRTEAEHDEISTLKSEVVKKPTSKKLLGLRNRIENIGRLVYDKISSDVKNLDGIKPIMIPPIPNSARAFIDEFPDGMILEGLSLIEKKLQEGYEAEVKLFRRLEDLPESVLVLHGLEYTHDHCSVYLQEHSCSNMYCSKTAGSHECHKSAREIEGECDFVVIGDNYVVLFEVKGVHFEDEDDPDNALKFHGSCKDGVRQIERIKKFIRAVNDEVQILEFIVFSNLSFEECQPLIHEENVYNESLLSSLVFSDNLDNFNSWFNSQVIQKVHLVNLNSTALKINLLGLWCIDSDNRYDVTSSCLPKCVLDTSNNLKRSRVTKWAVDLGKVKHKTSPSKERKCKKSRYKDYPSSTSMVDTSQLLKTQLNMEALSKEQEQILYCDDKFLWIDDPRSSGKTVVMLWEILQLALDASKT